MIRTVWIVALAAALGASLDAGATDRFVARAGTDAGNDCASALAPCRTIGHALGQAAALDVIKLVKGTYRESLSILASTTLTLEGGWSPTFTTRDPVRNKSRVLGFVEIRAGTGQSMDVTFDGLTIAGFPAAILAVTSGDAALRLVVKGSVLERSRSSVFARAQGTSTMNVEIIDSVLLKNGDHFGAFSLSAWDDSAATLRVVGSELRTNRGRFEAAAVGGAATLDLEILDSVVRSNRGSMHIAGANTVGSVRNTVFVDNRGDGGLSVAVAVVDVVNTTITGNRADGRSGAGVDASGDARVSLTNSIVWGNRGFRGPGDVGISSNVATISAAFSDVGTVAPIGGAGRFVDAGGNISADPLLRGTPPRPSPGSPVIDAGTCTGAPVTDIDGDPRPSGAGCDMGADEAVF